METEDNKENLNKDKSPPTLPTQTINSNELNNNISINIRLPIADRTESKLSLNSNKENTKSIQTQDKSQQTNYNDFINNTNNNNSTTRVKLELPSIRTTLTPGSKMMPIIKENASATDVTLTSSEFNKSHSKLSKRKTAPLLLNKEMKSAPSFFCSQPISNGFVAQKVNPTTITDFSYLNRNKLVNRRLALRKQLTQSGLKSISILPDEYENAKAFSEFALGNPNLNKSEVEMNKFTTNIKEPILLGNLNVLTPDSSRMLDTTINIESEMMIQAAANSVENIPNLLNNTTNTDETLLKQQSATQQGPNTRTIKSSSIVILEKYVFVLFIIFILFVKTQQVRLLFLFHLFFFICLFLMKFA